MHIIQIFLQKLLYACMYGRRLLILRILDLIYTFLIQLKGGEFPALRYSDEETERLLAEAYAAIPPRAGKRGTNHLKREKRRWQIKREYDAKKKAERIGAHTRRMAKRSRIIREIKQVKEEAPRVREEDSNYQEYVLQRWAEMNGHNKDATM